MTRETALGKRGIVHALSSAFLFGVGTPFAKVLLGDVDPWMLAGVLYLASGLGLAVTLVVVRRLRGERRVEASLAGRDLPWLAAVVFSGGVVGPVLLMIGLATTPASTASLMLNLEGLFTLLIAWTVFRENVDRPMALGAMAILAGAVVLSWSGGQGGFGWGAVAVAGACLAWGVDNNLTRKLSNADPLQIATIKGTVAGTVNVALALSVGAAVPAPGALLFASLLGFLSYGVSLILFMSALRHLGTARTAAYFSLAPFAGALVAIVAFGEPLTLRFVVAAALMGLGLHPHLVERHSHEHRHEPIRHEHRHTHDEHQHEHAGNEGPEPHSHAHAHEALSHTHAHYPDTHHRHGH